jgi:FkbM family methyltransferase
MLQTLNRLVKCVSIPDLAVITPYLAVHLVKKRLRNARNSSMLFKIPATRVRDYHSGKVKKCRYFYQLADSLGLFEPKVFRDVIFNRKYKYALDIGCNVGSFAWRFLDFDKGRKVFMIDANPDNIRIVKGFVKQRRYNDRTKVVNMGVSDRKGSLTFYSDERFDGEGTFNKEIGKRFRYRKKLKVDTVDRVLKNDDIDRIDFIKLDVEDWEDKAI